MQEFILTNERGLRMGVLDYGATITFLELPLKEGKRNVLLGCDHQNYPKQFCWLGSTVGRVANRIANATITHEGKSWKVDANEGGVKCLHGGAGAFHRRTWTVESVTESSIHLSLISEDGDQGFPGQVKVDLVYALEGDDLAIEYKATCDQLTPVSLTNHLYFNLDGGDVREHKLEIRGEHYLPIDELSLPLELAPVEGTPFDFRTLRPINHSWLTHPQQVQVKGYDHSFALDKVPAGEAGVVLESGDSRVKMEMFTDHPAVQLYTGNWLEGEPAYGGKKYQNFQGMCLEAQMHPNCVNRSDLGNPWLLPEQVYRHQTRYRFHYQ